MGKAPLDVTQGLLALLLTVAAVGQVAEVRVDGGDGCIIGMKVGGRVFQVLRKDRGYGRGAWSHSCKVVDVHVANAGTAARDAK